MPGKTPHAPCTSLVIFAQTHQRRCCDCCRGHVTHRRRRHPAIAAGRFLVHVCLSPCPVPYSHYGNMAIAALPLHPCGYLSLYLSFHSPSFSTLSVSISFPHSPAPSTSLPPSLPLLSLSSSLSLSTPPFTKGMRGQWSSKQQMSSPPPPPSSRQYHPGMNLATVSRYSSYALP